MTTARKNIDALPYSLHDMSVTGFTAAGDTLSMSFEHGFVRIGAPCVQVEGNIEFTGVDWDFCCAYILDICANEGRFTGCKLSFADFMASFIDARFEIADETYGYNRSRFTGYLSAGGSLKECVLELYHSGDMVYITNE